MAPSPLEHVVKAIAEETNTPTETVSKMYADVWAQYNDGARIRDFMPLLVAKRVRENLRRPAGR